MSHFSERDIDERNRLRGNPIAKHGLRVNRSAVHPDRKRILKRTPRKSKNGNFED
jgi:hypothetical protein